MLDALNNLAHDKALHAIGGSILSAAAMSALVLAGKPQYAPWAGVLLALLAGAFKEYVLDARANRKAVAAGQPKPHSVDSKDTIATVAGGLIVAAPALVALLPK